MLPLAGVFMFRSRLPLDTYMLIGNQCPLPSVCITEVETPNLPISACICLFNPPVPRYYHAGEVLGKERRCWREEDRCVDRELYRISGWGTGTGVRHPPQALSPEIAMAYLRSSLSAMVTGRPQKLSNGIYSGGQR